MLVEMTKKELSLLHKLLDRAYEPEEVPEPEPRNAEEQVRSQFMGSSAVARARLLELPDRTRRLAGLAQGDPETEETCSQAIAALSQARRLLGINGLAEAIEWEEPRNDEDWAVFVGYVLKLKTVVQDFFKTDARGLTPKVRESWQKRFMELMP